MSYEIVKGLKIKEKECEVWMKSSSNNVSPRHYEWWLCNSLSKILKEQGKIAVEKEILEQYWNGNFQRTGNLYDKSVQFYKNKIPFTWDNTGAKLGKDWLNRNIKFTYEQLKDTLYQKYIEYKNRPKGTFYIKKDGYFVKSRRGRWVTRTSETSRAKKFNSYEDALLYFHGLWPGQDAKTAIVQA